jgi:wobble nucleotide-excising tRNase
MVGSVNNPSTGVTGVVNDVVNSVGQTAQGINSASAHASDQKAVVESTGNTKALEAQRLESKLSDENQAALIGLQGEEMRRKQQQDVLNAIRSGKEDSANKSISATAQNAKGISF